MVEVKFHYCLSAKCSKLYTDAKPQLCDLLCMSYNVDRALSDTEVDFRLMDRIKPRLTRVAIALGFRSHSIEVLKKESDPEYYLLSEWLDGRSTRASERRPLTWGTLITALRHAGLMEEVRILEEHFIVTPFETVLQASKQLSYKKLSVLINLYCTTDYDDAILSITCRAYVTRLCNCAHEKCF